MRQRPSGIVGLMALVMAAVLMTLGVPSVAPAPAAATMATPVTGAFVEGDALSSVLNDSSVSVDALTPTDFGIPGTVAFSGSQLVIAFGAPAGDFSAGGSYDLVPASPADATQATLKAVASASWCQNTTGRLTVDDIEHSNEGTLTAFAARFEAHCDGADGTVRGALSYQSTVDYRTRSLTPGTLDFGIVASGSAGSIQPVTITNHGPADLHVGAAALSGPNLSSFAIAANTCAGATLSAGQSCAIRVRFAPPTGAGPRSATLTVNDDLTPDGGSGRRVVLTGTAEGGGDPTGEYTAVAPHRVLDTRDGTGGRLGALGPAESLALTVTGLAGVPSTGVRAVVLNTTVTEPTSPSYLTVWPNGTTRPTVSNLNYVPRLTVANLVTVGVGADGRVAIYNNAGSVHVVADLVGFYSSAAGPLGSRFHSLAPNRILDTQFPSEAYPGGPLGPGGTLRLKVVGVGGVPAASVTAVVMNVTAVYPNRSGFVTVYPDDISRPTASNLNFSPSSTVPNLVTVRVPPSGFVDFFNSAGQIELIADVVGYYGGPKTSEAGRLVSVAPTRLLDTREYQDPFESDEIGYLPVAGDGGVPVSGAGAVVLNVTVTEPTGWGYVTVFPDDQCDVPLASNLNYSPGQTVPNEVIVGLSQPGPCTDSEGAILLYNLGSSAHLIVDLFGYFTS